MSGRVLLDGVDLRDLPLGELRRIATVVEQGAVLVSGNVMDNLRLGIEGLTPAEAWQALDQARFAFDIRTLPHGLEASVAPDGERLSGGQRQRLALARALARKPRILLLDEATLHQDPETQAAIRSAAGELTGCTVITIAHRSDAVAAGARTVALEGG